MFVLFLEFSLVRSGKVGFDVAKLPGILNASTKSTSSRHHSLTAISQVSWWIFRVRNYNCRWEQSSRISWSDHMTEIVDDRLICGYRLILSSHQSGAQRPGDVVADLLYKPDDRVFNIHFAVERIRGKVLSANVSLLVISLLAQYTIRAATAS